jgi:hypothetical protein
MEFEQNREALPLFQYRSIRGSPHGGQRRNGER